MLSATKDLIVSNPLRPDRALSSASWRGLAAHPLRANATTSGHLYTPWRHFPRPRPLLKPARSLRPRTLSAVPSGG